MMQIPQENPLRSYFVDAVSRTTEHVPGTRLHSYLVDLLLRFTHFDSVYAVHDAEGRRVKSISEMIKEGDITLKAQSFNREREVHRHIGDYLLFWTGVFPDQWEAQRAPSDALIDPIAQGGYSYYVVSTFEHGKFCEEAPTFRILSERFGDLQRCLRSVRQALG